MCGIAQNAMLPSLNLTMVIYFELNFMITPGNLENVIAFDDATIELLIILGKDLHLLSSEPKIVQNIISTIKCRHFLFTLFIRT